MVGGNSVQQRTGHSLAPGDAGKRRSRRYRPSHQSGRDHHPFGRAHGTPLLVLRHAYAHACHRRCVWSATLPAVDDPALDAIHRASRTILATTRDDWGVVLMRRRLGRQPAYDASTLSQKLSLSPGQCQGNATSSPRSPRVTKAVRRSGPPKQMFVV